jgi:hypothetical protein
LGISLCLYIAALMVVPQITPLQAELAAGARFFLAGTLLSLLSIVLVLFGKGWKRLPLVLLALFELPFWYGFTLY